MKLLFKINISPNHVYNNRGQNFKSQNKKQNDKNSIRFVKNEFEFP